MAHSLVLHQRKKSGSLARNHDGVHLWLHARRGVQNYVTGRRMHRDELATGRLNVKIRKDVESGSEYAGGPG
jgi:hypothetical protein